MMYKNKKPKWLRNIYWRLLEELPEKLLWLETPSVRFLCLVTGHEPIRDQCGKPEHDYCCWCNKLMPGKADD